MKKHASFSAEQQDHFLWWKLATSAQCVWISKVIILYDEMGIQSNQMQH